MFLEFIPQLIGTIIILIVGYIVAKVLQAVVGRVLKAVDFDGWLEKSSIKQFFDRAQTNQTPRPDRKSSSNSRPATPQETRRGPPPVPCAAKSRSPENRCVRRRGPSESRLFAGSVSLAPHAQGRAQETPPRSGQPPSPRYLSPQCFRQRSPVCAMRALRLTAIVHEQGKRPGTAKRKRVEMNNLYIERSLNQMHQEDLRREVSANRSAKQSRTHRERSSFLQGFPGLFSLSLKRA